jgi:hypothetical protein
MPSVARANLKTHFASAASVSDKQKLTELPPLRIGLTAKCFQVLPRTVSASVSDKQRPWMIPRFKLVRRLTIQKVTEMILVRLPDSSEDEALLRLQRARHCGSTRGVIYNNRDAVAVRG